MTTTKTYTVTLEEQFILNCFKEANKEEIPYLSIAGRAQEAMEMPDFGLRLSEELLLTCLGQLIQRGLVLRIEPAPGEYCYRRA